MELCLDAITFFLTFYNFVISKIRLNYNRVRSKVCRKMFFRGEGGGNIFVGSQRTLDVLPKQIWPGN